MKNTPLEIREFLDSIPDTFDILEEGIDMKIQEEYFDYSHTFGEGELSEEGTQKIGLLLNDDRVDSEGKKKGLTLLAHLGTIPAFRFIEKFYNNTTEHDLKQWAALALQECRMFLESDLLGENMGFISSGLGGKGERMRYYYLVLPSGEPFTPRQHSIIEREFINTAHEMNCIVEEVSPTTENYVGITVLIPMDVAIGPFVDEAIDNCNDLGDFVLEHYYATNMEIPTAEDIPWIIGKVLESGDNEVE